MLSALRSDAAHIAAVMPHSPAKEGPLKKPIRFDYIADNMRSASKRLKVYANQGASTLANAFAGNGLDALLATPNSAGRFAAAQVNTAGGGGGVGGQSQLRVDGGRPSARA